MSLMRSVSALGWFKARADSLSLSLIWPKDSSRFENISPLKIWTKVGNLICMFLKRRISAIMHNHLWKEKKSGSKFKNVPQCCWISRQIHPCMCNQSANTYRWSKIVGFSVYLCVQTTSRLTCDQFNCVIPKQHRDSVMLLLTARNVKRYNRKRTV